MYANPEQQLAIEAGTPHQMAWHPIELPSPVLQSDLPIWLESVYVEWMEEYANPPFLYLLCKPEYNDWYDDANWTYDKGQRRYSAYSPDGAQAAFYYHGPMAMMDYESYSYDVELKKLAITKERVLSTPRSAGFGGRRIPIKMDTGEVGILWGPWIGRTPPGWDSVACKQRLAVPRKTGKHRQYSTVGISNYISHDLYLKAIAYFLPHLRVAYVVRGSVKGLEVYRDGEVPKGFAT